MAAFILLTPTRKSDFRYALSPSYLLNVEQIVRLEEIQDRHSGSFTRIFLSNGEDVFASEKVQKILEMIRDANGR